MDKDPLTGLRRPSLAKSGAVDTIGSMPDVEVPGPVARVTVQAKLQGWRRRFENVAPGISPTGGAFQVIGLAKAGDVDAEAALESFRIPDLPWSYLRDDANTHPFTMAIPRTEPRAVLARATACMVRWSGLDPEQRQMALEVADDRLVDAFGREVDPRVLDRAERLLVLNTAYVHPAVRGQGIGLRMLWGVVAGMGFTSNDAVVADPWPIGTPWSQSNTPFTPVTDAQVDAAMTGIQRLCGYYAPLGLRLMPARSPRMPALVLSTMRVPGL